MNRKISLILIVLFSVINNGCNIFKSSDQPTIDLLGTKWNLTYTNKNFGKRSYEIRFLEKGKLYNSHPNEVTENNDTWKQKGNKVVLSFNNNYAIYNGIIKDTNNITGNAKSKTGGKWDWIATRL